MNDAELLDQYQSLQEDYQNLIIKYKWQPISTAPRIVNKDILVYRPNGIVDKHIPQVGVDYWSVRLGNCWARSNNEKQPTHWMPLPEPPK